MNDLSGRNVAGNCRVDDAVRIFVAVVAFGVVIPGAFASGGAAVDVVDL